jgi:hypothetical protein
MSAGNFLGMFLMAGSEIGRMRASVWVGIRQDFRRIPDMYALLNRNGSREHA